MKYNDVVVPIIIGVLVVVASAYIHYPDATYSRNPKEAVHVTPVTIIEWIIGRSTGYNDFGFKYSDIVYGVFNRVFKDAVSSGFFSREKASEQWFKPSVIEELVRGSKQCPVPYVDYKFEYPPIVGFIWYLTTCSGIMIVLPNNYSIMDYLQYLTPIVRVHYVLQSVSIGIGMVALTYYTIRIAKELRVSSRRVLLFIVLPSTLMYSVYNWDILTASMLVAGVYYLMNESYFKSGIAIGASVSIKLLPIVAAFVFAYDLAQRGSTKDFTKFSTGLLALGALPYVVIAIASPSGLSYFVEHHMSWYCENCIYLPFINDLWSHLHRVLYMVCLITCSLVICSVDIDSKAKALLASYLAISASVVFNYVFSPQMMLLITPLAVIALDRRDLPLLVAADAANMGIMATFFADQWLRGLVYPYLVSSISFSPHTIDSPVQWIATLRNYFLAILVVIYLVKLTMFKASSRS
ncbi:MAG: hypothetical protein N3E36_02975 [Sulfolobales archaeon]|nr:hypothetical protein [Sulfolobales archaeon]